jgi:hypothetical protein
MQVYLYRCETYKYRNDVFCDKPIFLSVFQNRIRIILGKPNPAYRIGMVSGLTVGFKIYGTISVVDPNPNTKESVIADQTLFY